MTDVARRRGMSGVLTALAIIAGVLSMHAVSGGPHSTAGSAPSVHAAMTMAVAVLDDRPAGDVDMPSPADAGAFSADVRTVLFGAAPTGPSGGDHAMAAMCLAVLLAGAAVLACAARRRCRIAHDSRVEPLTARLGSRPSRAPPPDLLSELCVMRT